MSGLILRTSAAARQACGGLPCGEIVDWSSVLLRYLAPVTSAVNDRARGQTPPEVDEAADDRNPDASVVSSRVPLRNSSSQASRADGSSSSCSRSVSSASITIRLGPSLIGSRVFLGLDLLNLFAPWSASAAEETTGTSQFVSDQIDGYLPAMHEIAERFRQGDLARWTSLVGGGGPLLATPDLALFTPGRWLYLVLPLALAPGWSKLLEMCFAALFTYLFTRRLGASKLAAGLAGFIYPLTGFMIGWTNWPQAAVGSSIPMLFWAVERFVQETRIRAAIPIALASTLLVFGGFPAVAGHAFLVVGGYAVVRSLAVHRGRLRETSRILFCAGVAVTLESGWPPSSCCLSLTASSEVRTFHTARAGSSRTFRSITC